MHLYISMLSRVSKFRYRNYQFILSNLSHKTCNQMFLVITVSKQV